MLLRGVAEGMTLNFFLLAYWKLDPPPTHNLFPIPIYFTCISTYLLLLQNVQEWHRHCLSPLVMHLPALSAWKKARGSWWGKRTHRGNEIKIWRNPHIDPSCWAPSNVVIWHIHWIHFSHLNGGHELFMCRQSCVCIPAMLGTPAVPFELQHVLEPYHHWHEDDNSHPPVKIVLRTEVSTLHVHVEFQQFLHKWFRAWNYW